MFTVTKLSPTGKPPLERYLHSSCIFEKYLLIYGGRNDELCYKSSEQLCSEGILETDPNTASPPQRTNSHCNYSTIALNDICLYNIEKDSWITLALYGSIPKSRWGGSMCVMDASPESSSTVSQPDPNYLIIDLFIRRIELDRVFQASDAQFKFQGRRD
jgi:hypothetical protein